MNATALNGTIKMTDDLEFRIAKLEINSGDVLVCKFDTHLGYEAHKHINKTLMDIAPSGVKCLILEKGMELSVLTFDEIHSRIIETPAARGGGRMDLPEVSDA